MTDTYTVVRKAMLMEDNGWETLIKSFRNEEDARQWIADQKDEYFKPGDYYVSVLKEKEGPRP